MAEDNNDIVIEDDPESSASASAEKKLREKLKNAESKAKEYLDGWQRAQADFANLRKRDEEEKREFMKFAKASLVEELLPVLDSFNIALSGGHKDLEPLFLQMMSVLKSSGLEELDPVGLAFSPEEDQKVLEVLQKGYKFAGKVIRPAKVRVGEFGE